MNQPKVSIVTVVYNDAKGLEKTIKSVINQTYENVEFIIIDGGSTDDTVAIIKRYDDQIDYWVSEKDGGIYDAMNKGINASTGTWVNFMNAGDTFVNNEVLSNINFASFTDFALIYGKKIQNDKVIEPMPIKKLEVGEIHANHQSMFFNKNILGTELKYDNQYKIYGDYELVNRIYITDKKKISYINIVIADFEGGGISSQITKQKRLDKYKILYAHYGIYGFIKGIFYRIKKYRY